MTLSLDELFFKGRPQWNPLREDPESYLVDIEKRLIDNPDDLGDKLCWVYGHLLKNDLPLIALTAPMQEVVPGIVEGKEFCSPGLALCLKLAGELKKRKQYKLAISMLDLAGDLIEQLKTEEQLDSAVTAQYYSELDNLLELELSAAGDRREPKSYLQTLEDRVEEVKKKSSRIESKPVDPKPELLELKTDSSPPVKELTEKDELVYDRGYRLEDDGLKNTPVRETASSKVSEPIIGLAEEEPKAGNSFLSYLIVFLSGVLAVAIGIHLLDPGLFADRPGILEVRNRKAVKPVPVLAANVRSVPTPTNPDPKLIELERRVGKLNREEQEAAEKEVDEKLKREKVEEVSEPEEVNPELKNAKLPAAPKLPSNIRREQFPVDTPAKIYKDRDGRSYGPPPAASSRTRGFPVRQFSPAREYRIMVSTDVYTAPSLMSDAVVRLRKGARVSVVSKLGNWLEIRSAEGNKGYIYAQDAERS